jgi:hypothetical protein
MLVIDESRQILQTPFRNPGISLGHNERSPDHQRCAHSELASEGDSRLRTRYGWGARHGWGAPTLRRAVVSAPHGDYGANVNLLSYTDILDPVTGMTRYSGIPVSVHRPPVS